MKKTWLLVGGGVLLLGAAFMVTAPKTDTAPKPAPKPGTNTSKTVTEIMKKFVREKLPAAKEMQRKYGIPYLFALAQWGLESGWGKSAPMNNFFGIKATPSWKGKRQMLWTYEYIGGVKTKVQREFRAYDTWMDAVEDWSKIIRLKRYEKAFAYKNDPRQFAKEIKKGGYATSPTYDTLIIGLIDKIENGIKNELNT